MIWHRFRTAWNHFFFEPQSVTPICLFRIAYGLCVTVTLLLLHQDWLEWFGERSWVSFKTMQLIEPGVRLNLFTVLPEGDLWVKGLFWLALLGSVFTTLGLWTRYSVVLNFLCVASIQQRNLLILHGGDTFLRVTGFFLMFAPAGATLSLDSYLQNRRNRGQKTETRYAPWAQRMIQGELACLYFMSFWWKIKGHAWLGGSALYDVLHLQDLVRFPLPDVIQHPFVLKLGSWFALILEFALGTAIWWRRTRYPVLVLGVAFHLALEYSLNIPMFQWDVLSAYILFVDSADLERLRTRYVCSTRQLRASGRQL